MSPRFIRFSGGFLNLAHVTTIMVEALDDDAGEIVATLTSGDTIREEHPSLDEAVARMTQLNDLLGADK